MTLIETKDLIKFRGNDRVLDGISFKLNNGALYGVLDPVGNQKSTLLALLAGAILPDEGAVKINGFNTKSERVRACASVGYFPKTLLPYADMTPEEYLLAIAEAKGVDFEVSLRDTNDLIDALDLRGRKKTLCKHLTLPECKRLCLAQALIGAPDVLIVDEPNLSLSDRDARDLIDRIYSLSDDKTLFFGSKSLSVLRAICDSVILLSNGKLVGVYSANDELLTTLYNDLCAQNNLAQDSDAQTVGIFRKKRSVRRTARPQPERDGKYELIDDDK